MFAKPRRKLGKRQSAYILLLFCVVLNRFKFVLLSIYVILVVTILPKILRSNLAKNIESACTQVGIESELTGSKDTPTVQCKMKIAPLSACFAPYP